MPLDTTKSRDPSHSMIHHLVDKEANCFFLAVSILLTLPPFFPTHPNKSPFPLLFSFQHNGCQRCHRRCRSRRIRIHCPGHRHPVQKDRRRRCRKLAPVPHLPHPPHRILEDRPRLCLKGIHPRRLHRLPRCLQGHQPHRRSRLHLQRERCCLLPHLARGWLPCRHPQQEGLLG